MTTAYRWWKDAPPEQRAEAERRRRAGLRRYRAKVEAERLATTTERLCLNCREPFPSEGRGNWLCDNCRGLDAGMFDNVDAGLS